jgi:hypothetical protein
MKKNYLIISLLLISISLFAQKSEFKFGKIDVSDITRNVCPIDSTADAYVIGDFGSTSFGYVDGERFQTIFERHLRIKILKKSGIEKARITIPLYYSEKSYDDEAISKIRGTTYNWENGKVTRTKLEKMGVIEQTIEHGVINKVITMPNVKEGSVIELSYKITSNYNNIRSWNFQDNIPVLYSQYRVSIPEYFQYSVFRKRYELVHKTSVTEPSSLELTWHKPTKSSTNPSSELTRTVRFKTQVSCYFAENMERYKPEPYITSDADNMASIDFELEYIKSPFIEYQDYTTNWDKITSILQKSSYFGGILRNSSLTGSLLNPSRQTKSNVEKAFVIYQTIRDNFAWNREDGLLASQPLEKTLQNKGGSASDLNLLLVAVLKEAGFMAEPVALCTRNRGVFMMEYPILRKLNYVVAYTQIDGNLYLLDATDKNMPFGLIPEKCLNGYGHVISDAMNKNIELTPSQVFHQQTDAQFSLSENGSLSGTFRRIKTGYEALKLRKQIDTYGKDKYMQRLKEINPLITFTNYTFDNIDNPEKETDILLNVTLNGVVEAKDNMVTFCPILSDQIVNPFTSEKRAASIDFSFKSTDSCSVRIVIPQGYQVQQLPKNEIITVPDKGIEYEYSAAFTNNAIQVKRRLTITKTLYEPEDYNFLKTFYVKVETKEAESVILKK